MPGLVGMTAEEYCAVGYHYTMGDYQVYAKYMDDKNTTPVCSVSFSIL